MKWKKWSGKRLLTLMLALTLSVSSLGPLIGGGGISYAAEISETPDVSESPGKAGETEVTVRLEEPTEEATDTEEPDLDTEDPAESVKQPENSGVSETTEQEEPEEPGESEKGLRTLRIRCEDPNGNPSETLSAEVDSDELYEGTKVKIRVTNTGMNIWAAEITCEDGELEAGEEEDILTFEMPDADVEVRIYELESQEQGELSGEDSSIPGDFQGNQSHTRKDNEPDIELEKSARWTNIEDGYAELTITEKDTSDYSNIPTDYIIILDRTRTMALSDYNHEDGSAYNYMGYHSPCINPAHYYYKGGIYLHMIDYFTGYDYIKNVWFYNLPGSFDFWERHYNQNGTKIMPTLENGCYDRLSMAKKGIQELVDMIAAQNAKVTGDGLRSRVAFWSFADEYSKITGDKRDKGLYNYTPLTDNYEQVKRAVSEVKNYSGTYYLSSLQEAYDIITTRNATDSRRKNVYTKVIFISDGECETDLANVRAKAAQIRSLPNTELFTLAIGMTADASGAKLLQEIAGSADHAANFWQTLSFDGGNGSAFAQTLLNIEKKASEVKAVRKTLTDQIETKYWEPVEILSADGGQASLNRATGKLIWKVPDEAGTTYRCTVKLRLKEKYRYLLADAVYPTNRDETGAGQPEISADPVKAGAVLDYAIEGGMYHQQTRRAGVVTPTLKYGTLQFQGKKNWTVSGSRADSLVVRLMRTLPGQTTATQVNNTRTNGSRGWRYSFNRRVMPDGSEKPLIKYDERGRLISYQVTEQTPGYYTQLESLVTGGDVTDTQLYNEPFKVKVQVEKTDNETGNPLSGAEFSVFMWSRRAGKYLPYKGTTEGTGQTYETGTLNGGSEGMKLTENQKGIYISPAWLYYAPDNQGKFRVIETQAPEGYYGDWKGENEKNVYDLVISPDAARNRETISLTNGDSGTFENQRVRGKIRFTKNDAEGKERVSQGEASLTGAAYKLFAAADLLHQDGATGALYRKDEEIRLRFTGSRDGVRYYRQDPSGRDTIEIGTGCQICIENLELGCYYLQEQEAGEGYLVNPEKAEFTLEWQGEEVPEVKIRDFKVYEQVKKQRLTFYKVAGTDRTDRLDPLEGAGFSIYALSEFADGRYADLSDAEVVQAVIDDFRDGQTLDYRAVRAFCPAQVFAEADSAEVKAGKLVKKLDYGEGYVYEAESPNEYLTGELFSDSRGMVTTPSLAYGRYLIVETTVPKNRIATRPFVVQIAGDDRDGTVEGDGRGRKLSDLVILQDRPVNALVRIEKYDSVTGKPVQKPGASYVIHDTEGKWFSYYTTEWSSAQKKAYQEQYGDLVVQYSQGAQLGTYTKPYTTRQVKKDGTCYVDTPTALPTGIYELEEVSAPDGYILQGHEGVIAKKSIFESGNGTFYETEADGKWRPTPEGFVKFIISSGEAVYDSEAKAFVVKVRQKNTPAVGKISVYAEGEQLKGAQKTETGYQFTYEAQPVAGAEFEIRAAADIYTQEGANKEKLYEAGELLMTLVTDAKGQTWTGQKDLEGTDIPWGLPLGSYTVTQVKAGAGFALSTENAKPRSIEITWAGQEVPVIYRDTMYQNPRQQVRLAIEKQDAETGRVLAGAAFGLYAAENIADYRGKILVKKDTLLGQAATALNAEGKVERAVFAVDLPLGRYYVKELHAPAGYAGSSMRVNVDASYRADQRETISLKGVVKNAPIRVQINLMDWFTENELTGATLQLLDENESVVETFTTVSKNNPIIRKLEQGKTYRVRELVTPSGYEEGFLLKDGYVTDKTDSLELSKQYASNNGKKDVAFTVLDTGKLQVVSLFLKPEAGVLEITKEGPVPVGTEKETDENGNRIETPIYEIMGLPGAEYVLQAKEQIGYPDSQEGVLFEKDALVLEQYAEQKKTGAMQYFTIDVPEGKGELVKAERMLPDGTEAALVLRTGQDGKVQVTGLPAGSYRVVEVKAPAGYYRDPGMCTQTVELGDIISVRFENPKQEIEKPGEDPDKDPDKDPDAPRRIGMLAEKYGVDGEERIPVSGAAFTLYAAEDVRNIFGELIYREGTEVETALSGADGLARFVTDVPIGLYRIRETKAPDGYYSSTKEILYDVAKDREDDSVHYLNFSDFVENAPTKLTIRLQDDLTHNELADACLEITDEKGEPVETWMTRVDNGYTIRGLSVDKCYTITEKLPREGYLVKFTESYTESGNVELREPEGAKVEFQIPDAPGSVTEDGHLNPASVPETGCIVLENPFVTGDVHLQKDGEILESWTPAQHVGQWLRSTFGYREKGLGQVEFAVYAAEDIEHPDGVTGICFRKGEQVLTGVRSEKQEARGVTDKSGILEFKELYLGQYEIRELKTAEGYVRDEKPILFTLAYRDGYTSTVDARQGSVRWLNPRQRSEVTVHKTDAADGKALAGAEIGLYTAEPVNRADGTCLLTADTLLETGVTDADGTLVFTADLPFGCYYVKEITAPDGYLLSEEKQPFTLTYAGKNTELIKLSLTIQNTRKPEEHAGGPGVLTSAQAAPTGDETPVEIYLFLLLMSLMAAGRILMEVRERKRQMKNRD